MSFINSLDEHLKKLQQQQLYRSRRVVESAQDITLTLNNRTLLNFCSNDYLGLANHPDLKKAFKCAADNYGVGSGGSQLITGHQKPHHALEEELSDFLGCERVLLYSTGYMANLGVVSALSDRQDEIFEDKLNHASLIDAALLSRAKLKRFSHKEHSILEQQLIDSNADSKFVISDGVFSMDGDKADVKQLVNVTQKQNAILMLDDAHGVGVLGSTGRGIVEETNIILSAETLPILVGTFGKAFGTFGAFVAGSNALIEVLINTSRSYIYTTAMPAAVAEATRTSLKLIRQGHDLREKLQENIQYFRKACLENNLPISAEPEYGKYSAIQPLVIGSAKKTLALSQALQAQGFLISAIRPPTVPQGTSRLRVTFSANHTTEQIEKLVEALIVNIKVTE